MRRFSARLDCDPALQHDVFYSAQAAEQFSYMASRAFGYIALLASLTLVATQIF